MRRAARKDANQKLIVEALRACGASVHVLDEKDLPDLLIGFRGHTILMEVKDGRRNPSECKLRPGQQRFFDEWRGGRVVVVLTLEAALSVLNSTPQKGAI